MKMITVSFLSALLTIRKWSRIIREIRSRFIIHEERNGPEVTFTLIHITREGSMAIEEIFAKIAKKMYLYPFALLNTPYGCKAIFNEKIREMTMDEIKHAQKCWDDHCEAAWSGYD